MMPGWCTTGTLYKGLFIFVLIFIALEYLFGSVMESVFNVTRTQERIPCQHAPLLKSLVYGNRNLNTTRIPPGNSSSDIFPLLVNSTVESGVTSILISSLVSDYNKNYTINSTLPPCPDVSPNLHGHIDVIKSPVPEIQHLLKRFSWLKNGGHWAPDNCKVSQSVALIIPFRCRGEHLLLFLQHMHPFLKRQQLDYTIFIVEQDGYNTFNRAMLMNIGYKEALKIRNFDCFIFHDIDLLPEDDRNIYSCSTEQPRHMSVAIDTFNYKLPYPAIFGGVSAISREHFKLLNGFSNSYWGWGGEDDDMANRVRYHNLYISRYPLTIARYTMLAHKKDRPNPNRVALLKQGPKRYDKDGLNSLKYKLIQSKQNLLYTWILVKITEPEDGNR